MLPKTDFNDWDDNDRPALSNNQRHRFAVGPWQGIIAASLIAACAGPAEPEHWRVKLERTAFGPVEVLVSTHATLGGGVEVRSQGAAVDVLRALPGASAAPVDLGEGSWVFDLGLVGENAYSGESLASRRGDPMQLWLSPDGMSGSIDKGWFKGEFSGQRLDSPPSRALRSYPSVVAKLEELMRTQLYDPAVAELPAVRGYLARMREVAAVSTDDVDVMLASRWAWEGVPPFSHFEFRRANRSADVLIAHFDSMDADGEPVVLDYQGEIAVLRVKTLIGVNTRRMLQEALSQLVSVPPQGLLIDLRGNPGGAFAVIDLIEPLLDESQTLGAFYGAMAPARPLDAAGLAALPAWRGERLADFWAALAEHGVLKIAGQAKDRHYAGPVVVLVDGHTASAAELAAQALADACRAVIVGERTAGQMLSGSYFDLGEGFQVYLPVGDYYTAGGQRIEGQGVHPHHASASAQAEESALHLLRSGEVAANLATCRAVGETAVALPAD